MSEGVGVNVSNCCVWCLRGGVKTVESLRHVIWECPFYSTARDRPRVAALLRGGGAEVLVLHRARWGWGELRVVRNFLLDLIRLRQEGCGGRLANRTVMQEMAEDLWW